MSLGRAFTGATLHQWVGDAAVREGVGDVGDALLVVSGLLSNAASRGGGEKVALTLTLTGQVVLIELEQDWPSLAVAAGAVDDAELGAGLALVAALALAWGMRRTRAGQLVWAEVRLRGRLAPAMEPSPGVGHSHLDMARPVKIVRFP